MDKKFDRTTVDAAPVRVSGCVADPLEVVPVEAFEGWTAEDFKRELIAQQSDGPLCLYVCSATLATLKQIHDMDSEPIPGGDRIALDEAMASGVIRYDHGERQQALALPVVHYFAAQGV
jgi:hypothetical protein